MGGRAVLWDFDRTLATRDGRWSDCLVEALAAVDPSLAVEVEAVRPGLRSGFPWHRPDVCYGTRSADEWWAALGGALVRAYVGAGVPPDVAARAAAKVRTCYADAARWRLYPDVLPALRALAAYRHVVLSNHVPELPALVEALGLPVDAVLTSAATGWEKPHLEMFALGRAAAGHPDDVWMVGDNPVADVAGAEAVGIRALLVRAPGGLPDVAAAARVILAA